MGIEHTISENRTLEENETQRDKTNKITYVPSENSDHPGFRPI